ncbi:MAG: flagella basal body P-ring formation protein FlgA, partial [Planctomycetota bacterium]
VEPATRIFSDDSDLGFTHAGAIVGQKVKRFVPAGEMIRTDDLEAVDLVRRSRPVTVSSDGAIGLRVTGTALDAGKYGETIRVRLGSSRRDQRVIRGIVVGAGQVRMLEDG